MGKFNVERYRELRSKSKYNQKYISEILGLSVDAVKGWTRKSSPSIPEQDTIRELAKLFKVPMSELDNDIKRDVDMTLKSMGSEDFELIDYIDLRAGAGSEGILSESIVSKPIPVTRQFLNGIDVVNLVALKVVGDSMQPTINPEEFVIIDKVNGRDFYPVDGIYLINKDGTIQIKRLHFKGDKGIDIISDNGTYPKENTFDDAINLEIVGKLFKQIKNLGALAIKE